MSDHAATAPCGVAGLAGRAVLAAGIGLSLPVQAGTDACWQISRHFLLCADGSDWATAEWDQFGDGAALVLGAMRLDFSESWPPRTRRDLSLPPEAQLTELLAEHDTPGYLTVLDRSRLSTPALDDVARVHTLTEDPDIGPARGIWMIAEGGGAQILLMLTAPADTPPEVLDQQAGAVIARVQPRHTSGTKDGQ